MNEVLAAQASRSDRAGAGGGTGLAMARPYIACVGDQPLRVRQFDVLVLGGGIAGLTAAIAAARRWRVGLLTKSTFDDTNTFLAQGGIAAAMSDADSPELHFQDTVNAGAGLCDEKAVRVLVTEGPDRVRELMRICPDFDRVDGEIVLGKEGRPLGGARAARRRRRHRQRGLQRPRRGGPHGQPRAAPRGRVRHRPADRLPPLRRRALHRGAGRRPVAEPRHGHHPCDRGRRAGVPAHHQPGRGHRRRHGHGVPRRRRPARPGVRPVPSHRSGDRREARPRCWSPRPCGARGPICAMPPASGSWRSATPWRSWRPATWSCAAWSPRCGARAATTCTSTRPTWMPPCSTSASRRSPPVWPSTALIWRPTSSPWRPCATTSSAASSRTCGAAPRCPACTPAARWRAPACTEPTGWRPTPFWRASSSPTASCAIWTATSPACRRTSGGCASTFRSAQSASGRPATWRPCAVA